MTEIREGGIHGYLDAPPGAVTGALVLTHGAGGNARMPLLVAVAGAFVDAGWAVLRCDLPFRQKRPSSPPSPAGAAADRAGLREAVTWMRARFGTRVLLGGQSYGGRQASMAAAEDASLCDGLLLLSYPLHPPGKAEQLRTAHFPALRTPVLFVSGTKDPFGTPTELQTAVEAIEGAHQLMLVEGAGHGLSALGSQLPALSLPAWFSSVWTA